MCSEATDSIGKHMIRKFLAEPLVHFALAGCAIFGLFALLDDTPEGPAQNEIVVTIAEARWLADQYEATWRRPPQPEELDGLIDDYVKEEMLVREAVALGLDQNDTIVRRRLRQKMEFLSEAPAASATPDDNVLVAFFQEQDASFASPSRIAFEQILLPDNGVAPEDALAVLEAGGDAGSFAARTLLPSSVPMSTRTSVDGAFGTGFFEQMATAPIGQWHGPVQSGFGTHLVRVGAFEPSALPPFEEVRERVELEWRAAQAEVQRQSFVEQLAEGYEITRPDPVEVLN